MQDTETTTEFYTTGAAAREAKVSEVTLRLWARLGLLPCETTTTGVRLFRLADVLRVASERAARRARRRRRGAP